MAVLGLAAVACSISADDDSGDRVSASGARWLPAIPAHFPTEFTSPARNPLTRAGIELGRRLFYDPILSGNRDIACADCHRQSLAFSDGVALSTAGTSGKRLHRNSPTLVNLAYAKGLFWDGGARDLESQAFGPLMHPDEMAADLADVVDRLTADPAYSRAFDRAFATKPIASAHIARALAQFQRSIISADAKYDRFVRGEATLSAVEQRGLALFESKQCASCHTPPLFTDGSYHNNGLDDSFSANEEGIFRGRYRISHRERDIGRFKTPTLRNIAKTAPYMHDGRIASLDGVLDHYGRGVKDSDTLSPLLRGPERLGIALSRSEKAAIIAFLHTLTDHTLLHNPAHARPR
ncbi:MAG: c-type cytochrome [Proteobacteria bacterium]|nr:c-type cytochrome [Pseudomonadota bacterium]